jgi:hypothetical protein
MRALFRLAIAALITGARTHHHHENITIAGPVLPGTFQTFESAATTRALLNLKATIPPSQMYALLAAEIAHANAAWAGIIASSAPGVWVPARTHVAVPAPNLTVAAFLAWFGADTGDPLKLLRAHPEHYAESLSAGDAPGVQAARILEAWGSLVTAFRLPAYGAPDRARWPFLAPLPDYPAQAAGEAVLEDGRGTVFAVVHNSFKDMEGGGVEAELTGWMPSSTPEEVLEGLREHQAVEWGNWLVNCQRDIEEGRFVIPA